MEIIKFHRIDRLYNTYRPKVIGLLDKVYRSGQVLQGKSITELESKIALLTQRKYAIAVGSCTDALVFSLMSLGIKVNDVVLVTDFTFESSKTCILRLNAIPRYCPIENDYFMMDLRALEKLLTPSIKVLIVVNLFGQMQDMDKILMLANKQGIRIIEDAAQSFTSSWCGRSAGSFGDVSCLSFDPTKILPAFSTAGMVVTNDGKIANDIRYFRYKNYGCNSQTSTFQAELLKYWLGYLEEWEIERLHIARRYMRELKGVKEIVLPKTHSLSTHIWHKFVIKAQKRDELKLYLAKQGIETKIHYFPHPQVLSLPIYPWLEDKEVDRVIENIRRFYVDTHKVLV